MRESRISEKLCAVRNACESHTQVPVGFIGNEEEIAMSFGDFEGFGPDSVLSFGLIGEIPDVVYLIVEDGSAVGVANDESHRLDAVLEVGTGVDGAGHASDTYGSRHIHIPGFGGLFRADVLMAPRGQAEQGGKSEGESGAV